MHCMPGMHGSCSWRGCSPTLERDEPSVSQHGPARHNCACLSARLLESSAPSAAAGPAVIRSASLDALQLAALLLAPHLLLLSLTGRVRYTSKHILTLTEPGTMMPRPLCSFPITGTAQTSPRPHKTATRSIHSGARVCKQSVAASCTATHVPALLRVCVSCCSLLQPVDGHLGLSCAAPASSLCA